MRPSRLPFAALGMIYGSLWAQSNARTVSIAPDRAESGTAFQAEVSGKTTLCSPLFSHFSATTGASGAQGALHLSAVAENNPAAKCPAGDHDYTVVFPVPALKAGEYAVDLRLLPACAFSATPCPFADIVEDAGTLTVSDSADLHFSIRPKLADAGKAFDLSLIGKQFGCANEFSNLSSSAQGHSLYLTFTNRINPAVDCIAKDTNRYGPIFKVAALAAGTYQVFASPLPYCAPGTLCPAAVILPQLAGALTVKEGAAPIRTDGGSGTAEKGPGLRGASGSRNGALRLDGHGVTGRWRGKAGDMNGRLK